MSAAYFLKIKKLYNHLQNISGVDDNQLRSFYLSTLPYTFKKCMVDRFISSDFNQKCAALFFGGQLKRPTT
ncbi:MAG: hypothetical protein ACJAYJ_005189 [Saprospiraceae bacterium]|jgi:hypothetical protein